MIKHPRNILEIIEQQYGLFYKFGGNMHHNTTTIIIEDSEFHQSHIESTEILMKCHLNLSSKQPMATLVEKKK